MKNEFNVIYKYAVAMKTGGRGLQLVTRRLKYSDEANTDNYNYVYQISTTNQINERICTADDLGELLILMDTIKQTQLFGSAGERAERGYTLVPVMLSMSTTDCTDEIDNANLSLKREKALAKLTKEDKMVLGIE